MKKVIKSGTALLLAVLICLSAASCAVHTKDSDMSKIPLVYADKSGLQMLAVGESEPTLITKNFHTYYNAENKVQATADGKLYYIETKSEKTSLGDLYVYDIKSGKATLLHEGVYSFKVSADGETIIISDGTGGIFKYNKKSEKKGDYSFIQSSGVSAVLDISADGKYVLYSQVLNATNYYTLTLAKTDFKTDEKIDALTVKQRRENKDVAKGPVFVAENYKKILGYSASFDMIYFELAGENKGDENQLWAYRGYKESVLLTALSHEVYAVEENGEIFFSTDESNVYKTSDVASDKFAKKDAALKKANASSSDWKAKQRRDNIRANIKVYLNNITATTFYTFGKKSKEPSKVCVHAGRMVQKGLDEQRGIVFYGATLYNFSAAKKPDIAKLDTVFKLFEDIKSTELLAVSAKQSVSLKIDGASYNNGDCYVDSVNQKISVITDYDYVEKKTGLLYTVPYDKDGFGAAKLISEKAHKTAHFNSEKVYFVNADGALVLENEKTVVLKEYAFALDNPDVAIAFTSKETGEKNEFGAAITEDTAYFIDGKQAVKLGDLLTNKTVASKLGTTAYFASYDSEKRVGELMVFSGEKPVSISKTVNRIYSFE